MKIDTPTGTFLVYAESGEKIGRVEIDIQSGTISIETTDVVQAPIYTGNPPAENRVLRPRVLQDNPQA